MSVRVMSPGALLRAGVLVSMLTLAACGGSPLYSALDEQQANEIEAALLDAGIDADKQAAAKGEGWSVTVAKTDVPRAMQILSSHGLPRAPQTSLGEVFEKKGFVSSPLEERARYLYALSQELSRTLMQLDGVVSARVHIALPEKDVLGETRDSASASVVIIHDEQADLRDRETDIKAIVTDGIEGLDDVNRVTVKFFPRDAGNAVAKTGAASHSAAMGAWRPNVVGSVLTTLALVAIGILLYWQAGRRRNTAAPAPADSGKGGSA